MNPINITLGSYPGRSPIDAMRLAISGAEDPLLGTLSTDHIQICPQNCRQQLTDDYIQDLMTEFPSTQFRLHANVRVHDRHIPDANLSDFSRYKNYFDSIAEASKKLSAPAYTLHAGARKFNLRMLLSFRERLEQKIEVPVGIEGHYPTPSKPDYFWFSSWAEYRLLHEANVPFALDLSHLNIVAFYEQKIEKT